MTAGWIVFRGHQVKKGLPVLFEEYPIRRPGVTVAVCAAMNSSRFCLFYAT
jgi:hypothetical protein